MRSKGFTLVEMLVVILIISILLGVALLSTLTSSPYKIMQDEAARLQVLFSQIRDKALLENAEYGFSVNSDRRYQWWKFQSDLNEWMLLLDAPFNAYTLPDSISFGLEVTELSVPVPVLQQEHTPAVVFYSDLQVTPFVLYIMAKDDRKQSIMLVTDGLSNVEFIREE